MSYRPNELGALSRIDVDEARRRITEAHARLQGNTREAAKVLNVSRRHLVRLIRDLGLAPSIARMRQVARDEAKAAKAPR